MSEGKAMAPGREKDIARECGLLSKALEEAATLLGDIDNGLDFVCREQTPQTEASNQAVGDAVVPLAAEIRSHRRRVEGLTNRMGSILERLEL